MDKEQLLGLILNVIREHNSNHMDNVRSRCTRVHKKNNVWQSLLDMFYLTWYVTSSVTPRSIADYTDFQALYIFAPLFYRRYVDECFVLFKGLFHADSFVNFLRSGQPNIRFTTALAHLSCTEIPRLLAWGLVSLAISHKPLKFPAI